MSNINKTQESGRSMVEMLGVLAVIGVLSIAGVAGYTTAMNKHRANEILNAASVRAIIISTKLQKDSTVDITNALAEFGNETIQGVTLGTPVKVPGDQFSISLSGDGLTSEVCSQLKNIVGDESIVYISETCNTFTYKNDLSINKCSEYTLNQCPKEAECTTCSSDGQTKYKFSYCLTACQILNAQGTECQHLEYKKKSSTTPTYTRQDLSDPAKQHECGAGYHWATYSEGVQLLQLKNGENDCYPIEAGYWLNTSCDDSYYRISKSSREIKCETNSAIGAPLLCIKD